MEIQEIIRDNLKFDTLENTRDSLTQLTLDYYNNKLEAGKYRGVVYGIQQIISCHKAEIEETYNEKLIEIEALARGKK